MTRKLLILFVLMAGLARSADRIPAPLPPDKAVTSMVLPDGFRATVFAAEPEVVQPISFTIDARGRLWVSEALNYGEWKETGKDRIIILEDTDGDGKSDKRTVFYEGFNYITGIEVGFGGVWVISPPKLYFIPDRDCDDKPDAEPTVLFDGFGYKESRHNLVNGFTWGPDGWLYGGHGRTSPSDVGRPGTPADRRIHCDGGVYRIHPTRLVFENFADGTTNPWGVDFDEYGQCFVSNCVNPHLFHMIQGGHYEPWRNRPSSLYAYDRLPTIADHLHYAGSDLRSTLGTADTLSLGGGHAHCGTLIYLGDSFPAGYRNAAFMCNVHGRRINHDVLKRKGSGYTAGHGKDLMINGDPWFMGVTLRTGPDGSVFVSDWSDTGECHTYMPETRTGRIYKISYGNAKVKPIDLNKLTDADLVEMQLHRNDYYVRHARRILQERSDNPEWKEQPVFAALEKILHSADFDTPRRLRALWALSVTRAFSSERLLQLLDDRSEHIRAWVIQLLCERPGRLPGRVLDRFATMAKSDPSPVVRLYLASALQHLPADVGWMVAEGLLSHPEDGTDANLPLMNWYGIEPLVATDPAKSLNLASAAKISLVRQYVGRRVVDDALVRKADLATLVAALGSADEKVLLDLLSGAREALRGRKSMKMPDGWPAVYAKLSGSKDNSIREHAVALALLFDDPQALIDLRRTALLTTASAGERRAALEALIDKRISDLAPVLHRLLADKVVRRVALRGLAAIPHDATPAKVLAIYNDLTIEEKQDAVATLAARKEYALELLKAVESKTVPRTDVSAYIARQISALNDKEVSDRLGQVWGEVRQSAPQKKEQLARYRKQLTPNYLKGADLSNGRLLYTKSCLQCHKLYGEGGTIGPDLTGSNRSDLDYLLSNLIDPSAEVGRDFRMSAISMEDGRKLTGIVVERTPARVVVQTATERLVLAPDDVESVRDSQLSIMPEGQLEALTREQVRDLIAYVASNKQVPLSPSPKPK
jgi:putative membrane-bound dehydrogenase-like protein